MPRILSEQEYNDLEAKVHAALPDGLNEADYNRIAPTMMSQAIGEAENLPEPVKGSAFSRFASGVWDNINPIGAAKGLANVVMHPIDTATGIVQSQADQLSKAKSDYDQGHYSDMLGHGAAGIVPLIGPAAAHAGDQISAGDIAGGLGSGIGQIGNVLLGAQTPDIAGYLAGKTQKGLRGAAESITSNALRVPKQVAPTLLDNGLASSNLTKNIKNANNLIKGMSDSIDAKVGAFGNQPLDLQPALDELDLLRKKKAIQPSPNTDLSAIDAKVAELMNHAQYSEPIPGGGRVLKPQTAFDINEGKKAGYAGLTDAYGRDASAAKEAAKAPLRGFKQILDDNVPGVKEINEKQGPVIAARNALQKSLNRPEGRSGIGAADAVSGLGLAGGALLHSPALAIPAAAIEAYLLATKHPVTAMPLARTLNFASKTVVPAMGQVAKVGARLETAGKVLDNADIPPANAPSEAVTAAKLDGNPPAVKSSAAKDPISTVLANEGGYAESDGASGAPVIFGINAKSHPDEFAEAKAITDTKGLGAGQNYARDFYKVQYWDKYNVAALPPKVQTIVLDGLVNHRVSFGKELVDAAKAGAPASALVKMRQQEYQRLADANPAKYAKSLPAWNGRLKKLIVADN